MNNISCKSDVIVTHRNSAFMNADPCISSAAHIMAVRPSVNLPKLCMSGLITQGPQIDGQVTLTCRRWCHKSREWVKLCALRSVLFYDLRDGGASICPPGKWWEVHICNRIIPQFFFQPCLWFVSPWVPVLELSTNLFVVPLWYLYQQDVSSADSWWLFLRTGHIYRDATLSSKPELIKLLS